MDHAHRPFQSNNDLFAAARLVRSAFAHAPYWNAWNFARVDIWAQRRISDVALYGYTDWQRALQVWETSRGELAGAVAFTGLVADKPDPNQIAILSHPGYSDLYPEMLDWAEAKRASMFPPGSISVEVMTGHPCLEALLRARGYTPSRDWMFKRFRKLGGQIETYTLPAGFSLIELDQLDDWNTHKRAVKAVFNFDDTREAYASIQQAPSYRHNLDLVILAPDGSVASFCIAWVDPVISVSEFEPVGTMADYRRLGLGKAILAEAHRSLHARGIRTSGVESWSESPAATALYESAGLVEQYKIFSWSKE